MLQRVLPRLSRRLLLLFYQLPHLSRHCLDLPNLQTQRLAGGWLMRLQLWIQHGCQRKLRLSNLPQLLRLLQRPEQQSVPDLQVQRHLKFRPVHMLARLLHGLRRKLPNLLELLQHLLWKLDILHLVQSECRTDRNQHMPVQLGLCLR